MKFSIIVNIALNLMKARLKQTIVAGAGVTFGIAMFIALVSFMGGLNHLLDGLILNRTPHIRLYNEIKPSEIQPIQQTEKYKNNINFISSIRPRDIGKDIYNSISITNFIKKDTRIKGVAPKITAPVFYTTGNIELNGVVYGIDIEQEQKLFNVNSYIIEGQVENLAKLSNSIIIGKGLATKLSAIVGDNINVTSAKGEMTTLKIVGISQVGLADIDNTMSYTSLATAQKILGVPPSYITDIQVNLNDMTLAPEMAKEYALKYKVDAIDIVRANAQFETGSKVRSTISYSVGVVLLIVAGFGIYNILNMMIYEKMDTIAILKATGFSGSDVKWIFISLASIIGIVGGILGLLFGFILSNLISIIPFNTESLPTVTTYPVEFNMKFYIIGIVFALFTTTIAGLFPALKASKVDPVVIIRGK